MQTKLTTQGVVQFHDELNPRLFAGRRLRPEIRQQLLKIARDFIVYLGVHDLSIQDVILTGSNAGYNYTRHSDIDLHIVLDFEKLNPDEVYRELFSAKKNLYNEKHNIRIHGYDVELYVQDSNESHVSAGQYTVLENQWLHNPRKIRAEIRQGSVLAKFQKLQHVIEHALSTHDSQIVDRCLKKLGQYRRGGLDSGGEFSSENLAYKLLRSQGYLERLLRARDQYRSRELSLPQ